MNLFFGWVYLAIGLAGFILGQDIIGATGFISANILFAAKD